MKIIPDSNCTGFQREILARVKAGLPGTLPTREVMEYDPERGWGLADITPQQVRVGDVSGWVRNANLRYALVFTDPSGERFAVDPSKPWHSDTQGKQPPLGATFNMHPLCVVRLRYNGVRGWNSLDALERFVQDQWGELADVFNRRYVPEPAQQNWDNAPEGVVCYTEFDEVTGALVDVAGDVDHELSERYELDLKTYRWKREE